MQSFAEKIKCIQKVESLFPQLRKAFSLLFLTMHTMKKNIQHFLMHWLKCRFLRDVMQCTRNTQRIAISLIVKLESVFPTANRWGKPPGPPVKLHKTRSDLLVILPIVIICGLWYYNSVKRKEEPLGWVTWKGDRNTAAKTYQGKWKKPLDKLNKLW